MNIFLLARAAFRFIGLVLILYSVYALVAQLIFGSGMMGEPALFGGAESQVSDLTQNPLVRVALWYFALNFLTGFFLLLASSPLARIVGRSDDEAWKQP